MKDKTLGIILFSVFVLCLVALGLFYWFEYRPSAIKALCTEEVRVNARPRPPTDRTKRRVRNYYECLKENGLE